MWPLLLCSFAALVFVVERALFFSSEGRGTRISQRQRFLELVGEGRMEEALASAKHFSGDAVLRVLKHGVEHRGPLVGLALESQALYELRRFRKNLSLLDTIITAAPLLGILGTVSGLAHSFESLAVLAQAADPFAVTKGISEALITTVAGLCIALTTLIPYNFFQARSRQLADELSRWGTQLEVLLGRFSASPEHDSVP